MTPVESPAIPDDRAELDDFLLARVVVALAGFTSAAQLYRVPVPRGQPFREDDFNQAVKILTAMSPDARVGAVPRAVNATSDLVTDPFFMAIYFDLVAALDEEGALRPDRVDEVCQAAATAYIGRLRAGPMERRVDRRGGRADRRLGGDRSWSGSAPLRLRRSFRPNA